MLPPISQFCFVVRLLILALLMGIVMTSALASFIIYPADAAALTNNNNNLGATTTTSEQHRDQLDEVLAEISDITTGNLGSLCIGRQHRSVAVPVRTDAFEAARQKADMLARLLHDLGQLHHPGTTVRPPTKFLISQFSLYLTFGRCFEIDDSQFGAQ